MKRILFTVCALSLMLPVVAMQKDGQEPELKRHKPCDRVGILLDQMMEQIILTNKEFLDAAAQGDYCKTQEYLQIFPYLNRPKALFDAVYAGHEQVAELIMQHCATVNYQNKNGISALMIAAYHGNLAMCQLLLKYGAEPGLKDSKQRLAFDWAHAGKIQLALPDHTPGSNTRNYDDVIALLNTSSK